MSHGPLVKMQSLSIFIVPSFEKKNIKYGSTKKTINKQLNDVSLFQEIVWLVKTHELDFIMTMHYNLMTFKEVFVEFRFVYQHIEITNKMAHNNVWLICFGLTLLTAISGK